ncbi:MAG: ABC transporter [Gammaproteobacteria bacterium]|nr:MAG: ABC transporter [Gammaproteobacteria bacterium]
MNQAILEFCEVGIFYQKKSLSFRSPKFWALEDVSFVLKRGETLGVIGNNGSGKSTLLKLISGIIAPDSGSITSYRKFTASLLALNVGFNPNLTGRESSVLSGLLLGMKKTEIESRLNAIETLSGLGDFFDQPVGNYSTGMKARLGFSTAIQINPDVFLVDEILGVGDQQFRKISYELIEEKIKSNKTVVLVSHNLDVIQNLCDRVLWIEKGKIVKVGDTKEVIDYYLSAIRQVMRDNHQDQLDNTRKNKIVC